MKTKKIDNRKAVSPVIATVILVAVAITVAVAVAYWMGGIAGQYTKFEKVEIQTAYSVRTPGSGWNISMELKNTGSAASTLNRVFVNDIPVSQSNYNQTTWIAGEMSVDIEYLGTTVNPGESMTVQVYISETYSTLTSGTTVNVKIHSAGGMDYIRLVELV
jgi:flagellin-like protein